MTTHTASLLGATKEQNSVRTRLPADSIRFDRWFILLSSLFVLGIYIDGWAHNNLAELIETFFTPWHAMLYGGFFITAGFLAITAARNLAAGYGVTRSLPRGYNLSLIGAVIFMFGGAFDLVWHSLFGFEGDVEALLSPAHLWLASGAILLISAPLRAAWTRRSEAGATGWSQLLPALLSVTLVLSILSFFMQYATLARPTMLIERPFGEEEMWHQSVRGVFNSFAPTVLIMSSVLFLVRRWRLPFGTFTLLIGGSYTLMFLMTMQESFHAPLTLVAVLVAALIADLLYQRLQPSLERLTAVRWFAFLVPFTLIGLYNVSLLLTHGLWWEIHMWAGVPFVSGVAGLFLSFLTHPPAFSEVEER